jgi:hypothetical protein
VLDEDTAVGYRLHEELNIFVIVKFKKEILRHELLPFVMDVLALSNDQSVHWA